MRIMDLKYVQSELRKLSEIIEGWNTTQEIGSLERDLALDKLRTLYEAVRFGTEAVPAAADAAEPEILPAEIPVSIDLGEVLSIEPLPVAEPGFSALSEPGPEFTAPDADLPDAEPGAAFAEPDAPAPEVVAEAAPEVVPEPAGTVAEPAVVIAEPFAGETADTKFPVAGQVVETDVPVAGQTAEDTEPSAAGQNSASESPAAEEMPAPIENIDGEEVPAANIAEDAELQGTAGSQKESGLQDAPDLPGVALLQDEPEPQEASAAAEMSGAEGVAGPDAEAGGTAPASGYGDHPAAAPQPIAPTLFEIEEETQRHRHKQRVIMSLYNPETPAARPTAGKNTPAPGAEAVKPGGGELRPAADSPEPVSGHSASTTGTPRMFTGDEAPAEGAYAPSAPQRPAPVSDAVDDDEGPDFEEITLIKAGTPNNGAVLGEVINHDKQTLADTIVPPRDMASELRRSEHVTDLRRAIGINDKFLMIRDLFGGDARAYEAALDKLNAFDDFDDCMIYIAENYAWNANSDGAKFLMELLERKFA